MVSRLRTLPVGDCTGDVVAWSERFVAVVRSLSSTRHFYRSNLLCGRKTRFATSELRILSRSMIYLGKGKKKKKDPCQLNMSGTRKSIALLANRINALRDPFDFDFTFFFGSPFWSQSMTHRRRRRTRTKFTHGSIVKRRGCMIIPLWNLQLKKFMALLFRCYLVLFLKTYSIVCVPRSESVREECGVSPSSDA
jgi:hypothetical protein